jgi:acetyl esterase
MAIHPQARTFLEALAADPSPRPGAPGFDLAAARLATHELAPPRFGHGDEVADVLDLDADGVACRLYRPRRGAPIVVHLHGGGWVVGDLESHDAVCRLLAARSGAAVLAVDYRLAPEHPYPAAVEDCERTVDWLVSNGPSLDVDPTRLAVLGDSSGGNLAAALALRARDRGGPSYAMQVLIYPVLDAATDSPSFDAPDGQGLDASEMRWYWSAYAPDASTRKRPDCSPTRAANLAGLPPALVITAEYDVLRDEDESYAARLAEAGVPVAATRWLGMIHGFWRRPTVFDASVAAVDHVAAALSRALDIA